MSNIDILYFEKILIRLLFDDKEIQDKILPFLTDDLFDQIETKQIVKSILSFVDEFAKFPTINDIKITLENKESYDIFVSIFEIDMKEFTKENILKEIEDFFKKKMVFHEISNAVENLKDDKLEKVTDLPDKLRDAVSFSFKVDVGLDLMEAEDEMFDYLHNKDMVVSTGIPYFDDMMEGGFHEKSLSLYLGETRIGKSLCFVGLASNIILKNKNVLYVTFELSKQKVSQRILSNLMSVNMNELKNLSKESFHLHYEDIKKQINKKLVVREYPTMSTNTNQIRNLLKELKNKMKFVPDVIFLDYIGIMLPNRQNKTDNSYHTLKRVCQEVRGLSTENEKLPIISGCQVNRTGIGSSNLDFTDVADSIGVATESDLIIGITQTEEQKDLGGKSVYSWSILKNRFGVDGLRCTVGVDKYHMKIYPVEQPKKEEKPTEEQKVNKASETIINNIKDEKKEIQKKIIRFDEDDTDKTS
jgi:replicative DNA helicase